MIEMKRIEKNNTTLVLGLVLIAVSASPAHADVFYFKDGRVISGQVTTEHEKEFEGVKTTFWNVQLDSGNLMQISERELTGRNGHDFLSDAEKEYTEKIQSIKLETAEDHCLVAHWCASKGLSALRKAHYLQALDIDPDYKKARSGAGFERDRNGDWKLKDEVRGKEMGKVRMGNIFVFPEDIAIRRKQEKQDAEMAPIKKKMNTLHSAVAFGRSEQRRNEAIAKLRQIRDPREANLLASYMLDKRRKTPANVRLLYISILSRFANSIPALTNASLNDEDQGVRSAARDGLRALNARGSVPTYLGYLSSPNNATVNRAARGIGLFNPKEAVLPLIEALVTTHKQKQGGGNTNYNVQGGMQFGSKEKVVDVAMNNAAVLETLTAITGQRFDYNKDSWYAWYASQNAPPVGDTRRDP